MCMQCMISAMSSMAAANGTRAWLGRGRLRWLTPCRLHRVTIASSPPRCSRPPS
jgi:hypothetical protein